MVSDDQNNTTQHNLNLYIHTLTQLPTNPHKPPPTRFRGSVCI